MSSVLDVLFDLSRRCYYENFQRERPGVREQWGHDNGQGTIKQWVGHAVWGSVQWCYR